MPEKKPYNNYFVPEKDLKYVPPYFRDTPETTIEVNCVTAGVWPTWLNGTFVRYALNEVHHTGSYLTEDTELVQGDSLYHSQTTIPNQMRYFNISSTA